MSIVAASSHRPDPDQDALLALPADRSALVLGEPGTGKTTACLRRLAALGRRAGSDRLRSLVIVPTEGLAERCADQCRALRVADVDILTLDAWLWREGRRAFPSVPARRSRDAPVEATAFRRHPAVREALADAQIAVAPAERDHLLEVWGDRPLLTEIVDRSAGELTDAMAAAVERHAWLQHTELDCDSYGTPLRAGDGEVLVDGTPDQDAGTTAIEDVPVLFALDALGGGTARPRRWDQVVVDEAQEIAPMELAVLGRAVRPGGALLIAGDADQQADPSAWFAGWDRALAELGAGRSWARFTLQRSYRSVPAVMALARAVADARQAPAPGEALAYRLHDRHDTCEAAIAEACRGGDCAVIAPVDPAADRIRVALRRVGLGRVPVITPTGARGLSYDRVIVAVDGWPDGPAARRALYVAVSRARHRVELHAVGVWPALLAPTVPPGA